MADAELKRVRGQGSPLGGVESLWTIIGCIGLGGIPKKKERVGQFLLQHVKRFLGFWKAIRLPGSRNTPLHLANSPSWPKFRFGEFGMRLEADEVRNKTQPACALPNHCRLTALLMSASKRQDTLHPTVAHPIAKFFRLLEYVDVWRVSLRLWGKTSKVLLGLRPNGQGKSMASQHALCVGRVLGILVPVMSVSGALSLAASWEGLRDSNPAIREVWWILSQFPSSGATWRFVSKREIMPSRVQFCQTPNG